MMVSFSLRVRDVRMHRPASRRIGAPSHHARSASLRITADSALNTHGELVDDAISRGCGTI
jgi:hypothetical protein